MVLLLLTHEPPIQLYKLNVFCRNERAFINAIKMCTCLFCEGRTRSGAQFFAGNISVKLIRSALLPVRVGQYLNTISEIRPNLLHIYIKPFSPTPRVTFTHTRVFSALRLHSCKIDGLERR